MTECRICGGATDLSIRASERMFGLGGEYWYDRCASCGGLQLRDIPENLHAFYPDNYYAFDTAGRWSGSVRSRVRRVRDALVFGSWRWAGRWLEPFLSPVVLELRGWLEKADAGPDSRILDVGCGDGAWLRRLRDQGFENVLGVDPYIASSIVHQGRLLVRKGTLDDVTGEWDLITFHHSLEHIADQRGTLARVADLLARGGCCLIRIPTVSSYAWEEYKDRWVQLDAPRHLMLHSTRSLEQLADSAGLRVDAVVYDSTGFQFEGSEMYRLDRPLSERSSSTYSRSERRAFAARAAALNAAGRGDQAAFYLRHR